MSSQPVVSMTEQRRLSYVKKIDLVTSSHRGMSRCFRALSPTEKESLSKSQEISILHLIDQEIEENSKNEYYASRSILDDIFPTVLMFEEKEPEDVHKWAVDMLTQYSLLHTLSRRKRFVCCLILLAQRLGVRDACQMLPQPLQRLSLDTEEIKLIFLEQVDGLLKYVMGDQTYYDLGYYFMTRTIIPIVKGMIIDTSADVPEHAISVFIQLSKKVTKDDIGTFILAPALDLAHNSAYEDEQISAIELLSKLSPSLGETLCQSFTANQFIMLSENHSLKVRKTILLNLPSLFSSLSTNYIQSKLLPIFIRFTKDSEWRIRATAAEIIVHIGESLKEWPEEMGILQMTLSELLKDESKWVKLAAYKKLGPFIHICGIDILDNPLVEKFIEMPNISRTAISNANDLAISCAFNFPAVLESIGGRKNWGLISECYFTLANSELQQIRKTMAFSLHEIARILGNEITNNELSPIIEKFLQKDNIGVKFGILLNLPQLLEVLNEENRTKYSIYVGQLLKAKMKWRNRLTLAKQMEKYIELFSNEIVFVELVPILLNTCRDTVYAVRTKAAQQMHLIINKLQHKRNYMTSLISSVQEFWNSPKSNDRQIYLHMIQGIILNKTIFELHFLPFFLNVFDEPTYAVKFTLFRILIQLIENIREIKSIPIEIIKRLLIMENKNRSEDKKEIELEYKYYFPELTELVKRKLKEEKITIDLRNNEETEIITENVTEIIQIENGQMENKLEEIEHIDSKGANEQLENGYAYEPNNLTVVEKLVNDLINNEQAIEQNNNIHEEKLD